MNSTEMAGGRKTRPKYSQPHCIVRFSPTGQIIKVIEQDQYFRLKAIELEDRFDKEPLGALLIVI